MILQGFEIEFEIEFEFVFEIEFVFVFVFVWAMLVVLAVYAQFFLHILEKNLFHPKKFGFWAYIKKEFYVPKIMGRITEKGKLPPKSLKSQSPKSLKSQSPKAPQKIPIPKISIPKSLPLQIKQKGDFHIKCKSPK